MFKLVSKGRGVVVLSAVFLLCSCLPSGPVDPGYRELPHACRLVHSETAAELVGSASGELGEYGEADHEAKSSYVGQGCEWESLDAPGWGEHSLVGLNVHVRLGLFRDGAPCIELAKAGADGQLRDRRARVTPPELAVGDQSSYFYYEIAGVQYAVFYFRKANAEVEVKYSGQGGNWVDRHSVEVDKPREVMEKAARDVAVEALEGLGPPR